MRRDLQAQAEADIAECASGPPPTSRRPRRRPSPTSGRGGHARHRCGRAGRRAQPRRATPTSQLIEKLHQPGRRPDMPSRWPSERIAGLRRGACSTVAQAEGDLAEVEDELFRFARALEGSDELRETLTDPHIPAGRRQQIVEDLLGGKARPTTIDPRRHGRRHRPGARPARHRRRAGRAAARPRPTRRSPRCARPSPLTDDQQHAPRRRPRARPPASRSRSRSSSTRPSSAASSPASATPSSTARSATVSTSSATRSRRGASHGRAHHQHRRHHRRPAQEPRGLHARLDATPGRPHPRGRRRHRPRLGPARRRGQRAARVRGRHRRPRAEPRRGVDRRRRPRRRRSSIEEGQPVKATGDILSVPVGDGLLGRVVNALGEPIDGKGPLTDVQQRRMEIQAPGHHRPQAGARAAADRHQGHRRHDADRPGPARADHRRPQDRQDHGRASTRSSTRRAWA